MIIILILVNPMISPFTIIRTIVVLSLLTQIAQAATVNVYTERQPVFLENIFAKFETATGTTVRVLYLDKGVIERLRHEGINSPADAVIVADIGRLSQLATDDLVRPITSTAVTEFVPAWLRHPDGLWTALTKRLRVLYVSKDAVDVPVTYEELSNPRWRGQVCIRSGAHPYNIALIAAYLAHHGREATQEWLQGLKANLARKPQGNDRAQIKGVAFNTCGVGIANLYYFHKMRTSDDPDEREVAAKVKWLTPTLAQVGTHTNISGIAIAKHAPHPQEAKALVEFLVGHQAQLLYATENYELPVRDGVALPAELAAAQQVRQDQLQLQQIAEYRAQASALVSEVSFDN